MVYLQRWHGWCHMRLLPSRRVLCTPYNHAPCHFMQSHIRKVYACLAVTCHLRFWQNDRGLLRATAVTRRWNGYRNKSQHRKLTLENKIIRRSSRDSNPRPFDHESGALTTELSPLPNTKFFSLHSLQTLLSKCAFRLSFVCTNKKTRHVDTSGGECADKATNSLTCTFSCTA